MGQNALSHSGRTEIAGEKGVGDVHEQQWFRQVLLATTNLFKKGPSVNDDRLMLHTQTDISDLETTEVCQLSANPSTNRADCVTGNVLVNANEDILLFPKGDDSEVGEGLLESRRLTGELLTSKDSDLLEKLNLSAEREDGALPKLDRACVLATLEGRMNAHSQETFNLSEEIKVTFQRWEHEFQDQERLLLKIRGEVSLLQKEKQKVCERNTEHESVSARLGELKDMVRNLQSETEKFHQEGISLSAFSSKVPEVDSGKASGELQLTDDLRKCQSELASARLSINSTSHAIEELKEANLVLEADNSKLEQKNKQIQQQLCKEMVGQNGSYVDGQQTPYLLESTAKDMFSSIAAFSSLLSKYKDCNGLNSSRTLIAGSDLFTRVRLSREDHWKYLLREFICSLLFADFQSETFPYPGSVVLFLDDEERVRTCLEYFNLCKERGAWHRALSELPNVKFDDLFLEYLISRCQSLLPRDISRAFADLFNYRVERSGARFYERLSRLPPDKLIVARSFIVAAEKVWQFHKLCLSFDHPVTIFSVSNGDVFNQGYMESTDVPENDARSAVPKVAFMTKPGFRLRKSIIKCEVYLAFER